MSDAFVYQSCQVAMRYFTVFWYNVLAFLRIIGSDRRIPGGGGGGGGGALRYRGGRTFVTYFAEEGVFF